LPDEGLPWHLEPQREHRFAVDEGNQEDREAMLPMQVKGAGRRLVRKMGLVVCATVIVGALAGVARSQQVFCYADVFNNSGDVGACVSGAAKCLGACITEGCSIRTKFYNAVCVQQCLTYFSFEQGFCVGRFNNTTQPF
jgi:hypothetical protein